MGRRCDTRPLTRAVLGLVAIALAVACRSSGARPVEADVTPLGPEIARYATAHEQSRELRRRLDSIAVTVGAIEGRDAVIETADELRRLKRDYFALRRILFELAFLYASSIVERPAGREPTAQRLRVGLSLMAGTGLIANFHRVGLLISDAPPLRAVWDEADPAHGIPAESWELAMRAYHDQRHHDLFRRALERLTRNRQRLERAWAAGDPDHRRLFPEGVGPALEEAERARALLKLRVAEEDLTGDLIALQALVQRSRRAQAGWATAAPAIRLAMGGEAGLVRGDVHVQIQAIKQEYLDLREGLYGLAFKHFLKATRPDIPYEHRFRTRAVGISLLAAITLWENADAIKTELLAIPRVRALLNQGDPALGIRPGFWDHVEKEFVRLEYRTLLEQGLRVLEAEETDSGGVAVRGDPVLGWIRHELMATSLGEEAGRDRTIDTVAFAARPYLRRLNLLEGGVLKDGRTQFSRIFGTAMGALEFRKGKLYDQPQWVEFLRRRLRPGDLLLEKTPFRLTDKVIPGHFGHVALYVGSEHDLHALGLGDHPWVARHQTALAEGRLIVEALRDGTQMNTLEHFLNIDDLAILRAKPEAIPPADVARAILLAFAHVGKRYDFDFDNNTWDAIVCSELAFHTYVNVRWASARMLGSYTIAPDDVAVFAGAGASRPFSLVTFVHDGRIVHDALTGIDGEAYYAELLGRRYADVGNR